MAETLKVTASIEIPRPPNFLRYKEPALKDATVPIESLTDDQLEEFIELWGQQLMEHVEQRRKAEDPKPCKGENDATT